MPIFRSQYHNLGIKVTFILNILHKKMSIVAADDKAFSGGYNMESPESNAIYDYKKITLHACKNLALGIAGNTQDHYYHPTLFPNTSIDEAILKIQKHMAGYLQIHDRPSLNALESFEVNDGIATFYDKSMESYYTYTFLFSPVHNQSRLYRAKEIVQIFTSGSGKKTYDELVNKGKIQPNTVSINDITTPDPYIKWIQDVFVQVGSNDATCGTNAKIFVSSNPNINFHEHC